MKALLFSLVIAIFLSQIYWIDPVHQIRGDFGDGYEYLSFQYLVRENIQHGKFPLAHTNVLRYPVGFDLGYGYDGAFATFVGALLGFTLPQVLAYNITIVVILWFNFYFSFLLFRSLRSSSLFGIIGALVYGMSPYVFGRINAHLNLAFIAGFPLVVFAAFRLYKKVISGTNLQIRDFLFVFVGLIAIAAGSLQYLLLSAEVGIPFILLIFLLYPSECRAILRRLLPSLRYYYKELLIAFSLFCFIFLFFYGQYIPAFLGHQLFFIDKYTDTGGNYSTCCVPKISDVFFPNQYLGRFWKIINPSSLSIEKVITLGISGWSLFILFLIKEKSKKTRIFFISLFISFILLSLGILRLPYLAEGGRSVVLFTLVFLIVFSQRNFLNKNWIGYTVIFLLIIERLNFTLYSQKPFPDQVFTIVKNQKGSAVLNIPLSKYMAYQSALPYFYNKKIIDGYFHYTAEGAQPSSFIEQPLLVRYICQYQRALKDPMNYTSEDYANTLSLLRTYDIKTIVILKDEFHKFTFTECDNVRYWWNNLLTDNEANTTHPIQKIYTSTEIDVYDVK